MLQPFGSRRPLVSRRVGRTKLPWMASTIVQGRAQLCPRACSAGADAWATRLYAVPCCLSAPARCPPYETARC